MPGTQPKLKMIVGKEYPAQAFNDDAGELTIRCFERKAQAYQDSLESIKSLVIPGTAKLTLSGTVLFRVKHARTWTEANIIGFE